MSDIFREVDEALQQEKIEKLWKEYAPTIIASVLLIIVATAATTAYKSWNEGRNTKETSQLIAANNSATPIENIKNFTQDTRDSHEAIGKMLAANLHADKGEYEQALPLYNEIALDKSAPKDFRDLARILVIQNNANMDAEKQKTADAQLELILPVIQNEKSPWIWHARIEAALILAEQKNDYKNALVYLAPFKDVKHVPLSLQKRAQALAHIYKMKSVKTAGEK